MEPNFLVYAGGVLVMIAIYFLARRTLKGRREVTYHMVERILIFSLAVVLLLVAFFID